MRTISKVLNRTNQSKRTHESATSYTKALISPETCVDAKVPRQLSQATVSLFRHITVPTTANALGNASIVWSPFYLQADGTTNTTLLINNVPTYDGISTFGTGHQGVQTAFQLPANNVDDYRLVSASLHVVPQIPLMNSNGKIGGAVVSNVFTQITSGTSTNAYSNLATIANLESYKPYAEADVCIPESLRLVWFPHDVNDLAMYTLGQVDDGSQTRENLLVAYIVGAPAGAKFNLELFLNFEVTPIPGSVINGMGRYCEELTDPMDVLFSLKQTPEFFAHSYVSTNHYHQTFDSRQLSVQTGRDQLDSVAMRGNVIQNLFRNANRY